MSRASKCSKFSMESTTIVRKEQPKEVDFNDFGISLKYALDNIDKLIELKNHRYNPEIFN